MEVQKVYPHIPLHPYKQLLHQPPFCFRFIINFKHCTGHGDYEGGSFRVTFEPGETIAMVTIPINNDEETCECEEDFFAEMTIPDTAAERGIQKGENRMATIFISDNDGETLG